MVCRQLTSEHLGAFESFSFAVRSGRERASMYRFSSIHDPLEITFRPTAAFGGDHIPDDFLFCGGVALVPVSVGKFAADQSLTKTVSAMIARLLGFAADSPHKRGITHRVRHESSERRDVFAHYFVPGFVAKTIHSKPGPPQLQPPASRNFCDITPYNHRSLASRFYG